MQTFGKRLKQIRERRGWTQRELADQSGVPYETIYRVERGTHQEPRVSVAAQLARALGVSLDVLAGLYDSAAAADTAAPPPATRTPQDAVPPALPKRRPTRKAAGA